MTFKEMKHVSLWRVAAVGAIGVVALAIVVGLIAVSVRGLVGHRDQFATGMYRYDGGVAMRGREAQVAVGSLPSIPPRISDTSDVVTTSLRLPDEYHASLRTGKTDRLCDALASWQEYEYITFTSVVRGRHGCSFTFLVPQSDTPGVIHSLQELKPVEFSSNIQSEPYQEKTVSGDPTSRQQALESELVALQDAMQDADTYNKKLTEDAASSGDADAIAAAIDNRVSQIEQLSQRSLAVSQQLDALRAGGSAVDHTNRSLFRVDVRDYNIIDAAALREAWLGHLQRLVLIINDVVASVTIGMLGFLLRVVEIGFYLGVILVIAKIAYQLIRKLWCR